MTRLIDADALLEALADKFVSVNGNVIELINNAPTVQREGWVSVPIEPTVEMIDAQWFEVALPTFTAVEAYKAMIQAAPTDKE